MLIVFVITTQPQSNNHSRYGPSRPHRTDHSPRHPHQLLAAAAWPRPLRQRLVSRLARRPGRRQGVHFAARALVVTWGRHLPDVHAQTREHSWLHCRGHKGSRLSCQDALGHRVPCEWLALRLPDGASDQ